MGRPEAAEGGASRHPAARPLVRCLLLAGSPTGAVIFVTTFVVDGALHPGYDAVRQTISDLELLDHGWVQQANFIFFGLLVAGFAIGMRLELARGPAAIWFPSLQGLVALGLIASGVFVHNPAHTIASFVAFLPLVLSFFVIAGRFARVTGWRGWAAYSIASGIVIMALLAAFGTALGQGGPAGLLEKSAVLVRAVWSILFVARLLPGASVAPRT